MCLKKITHGSPPPQENYSLRYAIERAVPGDKKRFWRCGSRSAEQKTAGGCSDGRTTLDETRAALTVRLGACVLSIDDDEPTKGISRVHPLGPKIHSVGRFSTGGRCMLLRSDDRPSLFQSRLSHSLAAKTTTLALQQQIHLVVFALSGHQPGSAWPKALACQIFWARSRNNKTAFS